MNNIPYQALHNRRKHSFNFFSKNRRHNNRKHTKGRLLHRKTVGGDGGYVPNNIILAKKQADAWRRAINIFKSKSANYQLFHAHKLIFMQEKLSQVYYKFNLQQYENKG